MYTHIFTYVYIYIYIEVTRSNKGSHKWFWYLGVFWSSWVTVKPKPNTLIALWFKDAAVMACVRFSKGVGVYTPHEIDWVLLYINYRTYIYIYVCVSVLIRYVQGREGHLILNHPGLYIDSLRLMNRTLHCKLSTRGVLV